MSKKKFPRYIVTVKRLKEIIAELPDNMPVFVRSVGQKERFKVEPLLAYSGAEVQSVKKHVNYYWYQVTGYDGEDAFVI